MAGQRVLLRMSVGVHSGEFHFFLVGGAHRELIITGPAASTTVTMEGTADAGEILISERTAAALRPGGTCARDGLAPKLTAVPAGFPSGQRGGAVNALALPSQVRILPPP